MILLDTDHLSVLMDEQQAQYAGLAMRLVASSDQDFWTSVVSLEEHFRGWTAEIARRKKPIDQVSPYERLERLVEFYAGWRILSFDAKAANTFTHLKRQHRRIGTQDLKIAAIALANDALLLTANSVDFERIAGLRLEDWLPHPPPDEIAPRLPR